MFIELTVELKDKPELGTAKIEYFYDGIEGGVKLDRELDGFKSWNFDSLKIIKHERLDSHDMRKLGR